MKENERERVIHASGKSNVAPSERKRKRRIQKRRKSEKRGKEKAIEIERT